MTEAMRKPKSKSDCNQGRLYEAEMYGLQSLRLIAAPDPKDDLSDDELTVFCSDPRHSPELIRHLIEFVKKM